MYINGVVVKSVTDATNFDVTNHKVFIGNINADDNPDQYWFKGKMTGIKIYNRALSASEILENYNHGRLRMFGIK